MTTAYHFIAISSDYVRGARVGWHYASPDKLDREHIQFFMNQVELKCGSAQLGIHKLSTDSVDWKSVIEKDSFFKNIIITRNIDKFINYLSGSKGLTAYDVAKYILSFCPMSHLKLQKLIYYSYSEYLLKTGKKLFSEPIVAFKYGPVIEDIFYKFRHHGSSSIDFKEDEEFYIHSAQLTTGPSFVRIISSEDGIKAAKCILDVITRYVDVSPVDLVNKTHLHGGPWHKVYKPGENHVITDELIKEYHHLVI